MSDDAARDGDDRSTASASVTPRTVRRAINEIRREGIKAAFITSSVEAAVVFSLVNLGLSLVTVKALAGERPLPTAVAAPLSGVGGAPPPTTIPTTTLVAVVAGLVVATLTFSLRVHRPAVERFERANPSVAEALRTARDAVRDDTDTRVARVLYADVVARLRETSSVGLLPLKRLAVMVVLVIVASLLTVQATVVGVQVAALDGSGTTADGPDAVGTPPAGGPETPEYEGLQSGEDVLGEAEDVEAGSENLSAVLESQTAPGESEQERSYERSGLPSSSETSVEPRQAGFEAPEELEDADLIREYNLQIRAAAEEES